MQEQHEMPSDPGTNKAPPHSAWEMELLGITADANELIARIYSGQQGDLDSLIGSVIADRPDQIPIEIKPEMQAELNDAA